MKARKPNHLYVVLGAMIDNLEGRQSAVEPFIEVEDHLGRSVGTDLVPGLQEGDCRLLEFQEPNHHTLALIAPMHQRIADTEGAIQDALYYLEDGEVEEAVKVLRGQIPEPVKHKERQVVAPPAAKWEEADDGLAS